MAGSSIDFTADLNSASTTVDGDEDCETCSVSKYIFAMIRSSVNRLFSAENPLRSSFRLRRMIVGSLTFARSAKALIEFSATHPGSDKIAKAACSSAVCNRGNILVSLSRIFARPRGGKILLWRAWLSFGFFMRSLLVFPSVSGEFKNSP